MEVKGNVQIDWMYPEIEIPRDVLSIALYHVRAANDIEIEYNGDRDGYEIFRIVKVGHDDYKRKSVAFIPSWDPEELEYEGN